MVKSRSLKFKKDLILVGASLAVAAFLWQANFIDAFFQNFPELGIASAFIFGFFFTSALTTTPAVAMLAKISQFHPIMPVAFLGAVGALLGDAIIFYFIRDRLANDFLNSLKKTRVARIQKMLESKFIRFSLAIASGVLIALPLPTDETAFALMGVSKTTTKAFIAIAFIFNFLAILSLAVIVNHLV